MNKHYGRKVMLFIDEYDVPIQEGYLRKGNPIHMRSLGTFEEPNTRFGLSQHDEMIAIIRTLLTSALKDNSYVEKSLITGILRVAKESIFYGLKIPNKEVDIFYENLIEKWFKETLNNQKYNTMLKALITKDIEVFEENRYEVELKDRNVANIWKVAIVFKGKRVKILEG